MIRLLAAVQTRKDPFFHTVQTDWSYTDSGPPEPTIITTQGHPTVGVAFLAQVFLSG